MERLRPLGLVKGNKKLPRSVVEAIEQSRLVGGMSIAIDARPDEVIGPLTTEMGGVAAAVRVMDVQKGPPMSLELDWAGELESWTVKDVPALVDQLNKRFIDEEGVKVLVMAGEYEEMLQVWAVREDVLEVLLSTSLLSDAWNVKKLRRRFDEEDGDEEE